MRFGLSECTKLKLYHAGPAPLRGHAKLNRMPCETGINGMIGKRDHSGGAASRAVRPPRAWRLLIQLAVAAFAVAAQASTAAQLQSPLQLEYRLRIAQPSEHLAEVEIDARGVGAPTLDFVMPAWSPGRYAIYDFAKNVQEFTATDAEGHALAWSQPDKQTWRVETGDAIEIHACYKVFGNDLNGSFSQIDATHANLNGASIFMYVAGHKPDPVHLEITAPGGWKVVSGYSLDPLQRSFQAANYDRLIDTPLEIGPGVTWEQFTERGKTFRVAVHDYGTDEDQRAALVKQLADGVHKIVAVDMAMMPEPDFDHYTFLFHFAPEIAAGDGMEHLNSTQIIISQLLSDDGIDEALTDAAHEFFHTWNVKRLRPAALGPFDYTKEDYTESLWFAEGVTSYYSYVALRRAGTWSETEFRKRLSGEIQTFESEPGRKLMSAESSSFHAWFYDRSPQMQETNFANTTISYYNKGAILGILLDLEIRARTGGRKSLDDVMRLMYQRFYGAPAATYYLPGRGYGESDILQAVNEVTLSGTLAANAGKSGGSDSDFTDFFRRYVQGTDPLPYSEILAKAGLSLKIGPGDSEPSLGVQYRPANTGILITSVRPGGAADRAGLSRDDLLVAVDNFSLATDSLADRLKIYPPGAEVPFTVQRHADREIVTVKLDPPRQDDYTIDDLPDATPEQAALRRAWLAEPARTP
jgi:predicted metalloprotease with PDZ domain